MDLIRDRTVHVSRTMMSQELAALFAVTAQNAAFEDYQRAILEDNVLLKRTVSNREKTLRFLRELYALESSDPVFGPMRYLWYAEGNPEARNLLALLVATFRDEVLRPTSAVVFEARSGEVRSKEDFARSVGEAYPGRFGDKSLDKIGRNIAATWTQSGHFKGRYTKVRAAVTPTPAVTAFAFYLGWLTGERGLKLYETLWCRLLDGSENEIDQQIFGASQRGWASYKRMGDVVEIDMSPLARAVEVWHVQP